MKKEKHTVIVVWGEDASSSFARYFDQSPSPKKPLNKQEMVKLYENISETYDYEYDIEEFENHINEYDFNTKEEANAFLLALNEADGWLGNIVTNRQSVRFFEFVKDKLKK